ncbi:MAG: LysR family transcriptional regulator [Burkholderiaceae bacterium]
MTFDQIRSFYLIAVLGTFAQAARRMNTTQPGISARIAALESHLNVKLFDRAGQRATLTNEGRRFLRSAEKLLEIQSEILTETGAGQLTEVVRIGVSDTMAVTWVPGFLADLRQAFPDIFIELSTGPSFQIRDGLVERQLDVGFMVGPVSDPGIVNHILCDCPMVMAAPPAMNLHQVPLSSAQLEKLHLVTFERDTRPYQELLAGLRQAGLSPRINPVNSLRALTMLICKGFGVGVLPLAAIEQEVSDAELVLLDSPLKLSDIRFAACFPEGPDTWPARLITDRAVRYLHKMEPSPAIKVIATQPDGGVSAS